MLKRKLNILLLVLSFFNINAQSVKKHFIIASGSRGGNYYKTGKFIASRYNHTFLNSFFSVVETDGSNENIELIKDNSVDFAIVQRNVLINNIYKKGEAFKNLVVISPLFQEKLQIYIHGNQQINLRELESLFNSKEIKIGYTSKQGYSYLIFKKLTKFLNINLTNVTEIEGNYDYLIEKFKTNQIDVIVSFSLPLQSLENIETIKKAYISKEDALIIESRIHNVFATKIAANLNQYSLGSWSFFVGSKSSIQLIKNEDKLFGSLYDKSSDTINNSISSVVHVSLKSFLKNDYNEISQLKNLPLSSGLKSKLNLKSSNYQLYFFLFFILLFVFYFFVIKKIKIDLFFIWNRYKHFLIGFLMLIFVYFSSIELLIYAEKSFYENIGIKSQILNMSRANLNSWLLITVVTGNSNDIFPLSLLGKGMLALNSMNFWIGTILIGLSEFATYKINKKRKQGFMETKYTNHIIIFGWNTTTESFIIETINDAKSYNNTKIYFVCVVPDIENVRTNWPKIRDLHDRKIIDIIQGNALETGTLNLCHVERASAVILLSEDGSKLSDERTAMRAHAISRYAKKHKNENLVFKIGIIDKVKQKIKKTSNSNNQKTAYKKYNIEKSSDTIYMIAELNDDKLRDTLIDADVNEIIVAGNYKKSIIKQSIFNHGISKVLDEIMEYNEYNEFYKIDLSIEENSHLRYKNYDELLVALRKQGILLIGIHIVFHDKDNHIIIDKNVIQQLLEKEEDEGITRDIMVNPTNEIECKRLVDEDDHLIVLATNVEQLKKSVKNVVF